jgi:16S rRNA (cytosine967-C5)-methyltransferase
VLTEQEKGGFSDRLLKRELRRAGLEPREAALCTRLCYGVLQNRALLDFYLAGCSSIPLSRLEARVLNILRLGAYQTVFLDKTPDYAAVSACVDMARAVSNPKTAGYVNAVLRALLRKPTLPVPGGPTAQRLSVLYSQPLWQTETYLARLGEAETEALLAKNNEIPPLWIQHNPCRGTAEQLAISLVGEGVKLIPHPWLPGCFALENTGDMERLEAFRAGRFLVADPAARLAVLAADPRPGDRVIDGCAAPGGKSFLAAMAMEDRGEVLAFDIHPHKLTLLEKGRDRLGLTAVKAGLKDAGVSDPALFQSADLVVADLPCSGLGVVGKKPDIRYKREEDIRALPVLQLSLLQNLSRYVKPGGTLLYATCTLRREENEAVAQAFLAADPAFAPTPFALPEPIGPAVEGMFTLWPHKHETDGFFIAKFVRLPNSI